MENGCYILSDKRYKDSKCVYYRYGVMYPGNKGQYLFDGDGNRFYDKRTPYYNLPSFIQEPFTENKKTSNSYLLGNYKIKKVIQIKNSGGVYMGEDKQVKKVLIKEARLNVSDYLENGAQLSKKNEADILKFLTNNKHTPKLLESFYDWENYYLIEEFIEGKTYYVLKNTLYTSLDETNATEDIINNYKKINKIFVHTLKAVESIHQNNVYIGDISDLNILYDEHYKPTFIDLEHGFILEQGSPTFYARTSGYYNNKTNSLEYKRQDFQQIGYLFMNMFCKSNLLNALDLSGDLAWHQFSLYCKKNNVPDKYKKLVHMLVYDCEINANELIGLLERKDKQLQTKKTKITLKINKYISETNRFFEETKKTAQKYFENEHIPVGSPDRSTSSFLFGAEGIKQVYGLKKAKKNVIDESVFDKLYLATIGEYADDMGRLLDEINGLINTTEDMSLSSGLSGILCMLHTLELTFDSPYIGNAIERGRTILKKQLTKKINRYEKLGLVDGLLGCVYYFAYNKNEKYLTEDIEVLSSSTSYYLSTFINPKLKNYMAIQYKGAKYSPYIEDGTCGLILVLLLYLSRLERDSVEYVKVYSDVERLAAKQLVGYTQNGTFLQGTSGIGYTLLKVYEVTDNHKYLEKAIELFNNLDMYTFIYDNNLNTYAPTFSNIGIDVAYGISGLGLFTKKLNNILVNVNKE